jgi:hypothetical protein
VLTTRHPLSAKVGTNFADKRRRSVGIVRLQTKTTEFFLHDYQLPLRILLHEITLLCTIFPRVCKVGPFRNFTTSYMSVLSKVIWKLMCDINSVITESSKISRSWFSAILSRLLVRLSHCKMFCLFFTLPPSLTVIIFNTYMSLVRTSQETHYISTTKASD